MSFSSPEVLSGSEIFCHEDAIVIPPTPQELAIDDITVSVARRWIEYNSFTNGRPWPFTNYAREILEALEEARRSGVSEDVIEDTFKAAMANCQ